MSSAVLLKTQMVDSCNSIWVTVTCRPRLLDRPVLLRATGTLSFCDRVCMKLLTRVVLSARYSLPLAVLVRVTSRPLCRALVNRRSRVEMTETLWASDVVARLWTRRDPRALSLLGVVSSNTVFSILLRTLDGTLDSSILFLHLTSALVSSRMVADPLELDGLMTVAILLGSVWRVMPCKVQCALCVLFVLLFLLMSLILVPCTLERDADDT